MVRCLPVLTPYWTSFTGFIPLWFLWGLRSPPQWRRCWSQAPNSPSRAVVDHSIDFRILALRARWNDNALKGCFVNSLSEQLKDQIATSDEPETLNDLINLAIRIDYRLQDRNRERNSLLLTHASTSFSKPAVQPCSSPSPKNTKVGPLRVGRTLLSQKEHQRRINSKLCIYCGEHGHFIAICPRRLNSRSYQ